MANISRKRREYIEALEEQYNHLISSCKTFDLGELTQSKVMSSIIRNIVHQTGNSTSLLTHLGLENSLKFVSTEQNFDDAFIFLGLCELYFYSDSYAQIMPYAKAIFLPKLDTSPDDSSWSSFNKWWNQMILINCKIDWKFSRKDLVLTMANKDGGSHIDKKVNEKYYNMIKAIDSICAVTRINPHTLESEFELVGDFHLFALRQIAHEVIISLRNEFNFKKEYQPTKRWSHLKQKQRDWIYEQTRILHQEFVEANNASPRKHKKQDLITDVMIKVDERGIWLPAYELRAGIGKYVDRLNKKFDNKKNDVSLVIPND